MFYGSLHLDREKPFAVEVARLDSDPSRYVLMFAGLGIFADVPHLEQIAEAILASIRPDGGSDRRDIVPAEAVTDWAVQDGEPYPIDIASRFDGRRAVDLFAPTGGGGD